MKNFENTPHFTIKTNEEHELGEKIKIAAQYLNRLDHYVESVQINPDSGEIVYEKPKFEELTDENVKKYQNKFTKLKKTFADKNKTYRNILRNDPNILDVKEIAGTIIATYDSSKGIPLALKEEMMIERSTDDARGVCGTTSEKYLGLAIIDINKEKRKDGVSPTISAIHELHHYTLSISDYLISQDETLNMQSAYRKGRVVALYGSQKERVTTNQAFLNDKEHYSKLLGRTFDLYTELVCVEAQLSYLDELHSSFLQRKENWFNAQENVYSTKGEGKHWELVGNHPKDIEASKRLLGYLQGFYTLDKIRESWQQQLNNGQQLGPGQKKFLITYIEEFRKIGSLIGAARTIKQAEMLIAEAWNDFTHRNQKLITTKEFSEMLDQWEKGAGVENLRTIIMRTY